MVEETREAPRGPEGGSSKVSGSADGASTVFRVAEASTQEVLLRYQTLLRQSEREREAFLNTLHDLSLSHKETHWLDWNISFLESELDKLKEDRGQLQEGLNLGIHRALHLKDEVRRLEQQNIEDRMRIQRLAALSQPVEHDITFMAVPPKKGGGETDLSTWQEEAEDWVEKMLGTEKDPSILDQLLTIKSLNEDIEVAKKSYQEEVVRLQSERSVREIQADKSLREVLKRLSDAGELLKTRELDLEEATKQYLQLICDSQGYKNQCLDEQAALVHERRLLAEEMASFHDKLRHEVTTRTQVTNKEGEASVKHLEAQLQSLEEEVCMIVEQYTGEKPALDKRIEELENKLKSERRRFRKEQVQSGLDQQGYEADVKALNAQWIKAKRLEQYLLQPRGDGSSASSSRRRAVDAGGATTLQDTDLQDLMWKLELFSKERTKGWDKR